MRLGVENSVNEAFRMLRSGQAKSVFALLENALGAVVMDAVRGEHPDPGMTMLGVVPGEEGPAEGGRYDDRATSPAARVAAGRNAR